MNRNLLALCIGLSLAQAAYANAESAAADSNAADASSAAGSPHDDSRNGKSTDTQTLGEISVSAKLDQARNQLSPDVGSSDYIFDRKAIDVLPLGEATPLNQLLLRAPGVTNDSYGQLHVRGDHADLQYRINGVIIPESISGFGQALDTRIIDRLSFLTGALPAQYGYRTAGVVDITTRSTSANGNADSVGATSA